MPFQVEKTRLNGKYFSISAAGVFTPNLSVNVQHGTSTGHDSAPSRPKFPSTAVVPMASSIPKDKATGHGAWSTRRVLRKARSSHLGNVPNTSA